MEIGVKQFRSQISRMLDRVQRGERIVVVRHGKPAAIFAPVESPGKRLPGQADFRATLKVKGRGTTLSELVAAGRDAERS